MVLTGLIMILAVFAFGVIVINDPELKIPFADDHTAVFIEPKFGWSFYLPLFTGIALFFLGIAIYMMDYFIPRKIAAVFHHSIVEEDEFFQVCESILDILLLPAVTNQLFSTPAHTHTMPHKRIRTPIQVDEEEEKPSLEEYGVATKGVRRGETGRITRGGRTTTRRGLSRYRQTQRKPRSTVRSRGGSQRLHDDIQLEEIPANK